MDEFVWEQVFRIAIKSDFQVYQQFQLTNKRLAAIANRIVSHEHPVPESLNPDWPGTEIFPKIVHLTNRSTDLIRFTERDRFSQTISLPREKLHVTFDSMLEAIVFITKPQIVTLKFNGIPIQVKPKNGVVWLAMLPSYFSSYTRIDASTPEPCQVKLVWHEFRIHWGWNSYWFNFLRAWFGLGDQVFLIYGSAIFQHDSSFPPWQNWISIYPYLVSQAIETHRKAHEEYDLKLALADSLLHDQGQEF